MEDVHKIKALMPRHLHVPDRALVSDDLGVAMPEVGCEKQQLKVQEAPKYASLGEHEMNSEGQNR